MNVIDPRLLYHAEARFQLQRTQRRQRKVRAYAHALRDILRNARSELALNCIRKCRPVYRLRCVRTLHTLRGRRLA